MTAGSPSVRGSLATRTQQQTDRIARLYAEGHPTHQITLIARCTRARALHVAAHYGWTLDAAGRLPRQQRPAVTPGKPVPRHPAGMGPEPSRTPLPPIPAQPPAPSRRGRPRTQIGYCSVPGCGQPARTLGMCNVHYMRARRAAS